MTKSFLAPRWSGGDPPAAVVALISAETDGNPFFIEEVVKHLKDEGRPSTAEGG